MGGHLKAKLTKISSSHENLRTKDVEGEIDRIPAVGGRLSLVGVGIDFGSRLVVTSEVVSIYLIDRSQERDLYHIQTKNSEYSLEVYGGSRDKTKEAN
jgi:hypothetical protein